MGETINEAQSRLLLDGVMLRRSISPKRLSEPAPSPDELEAMVRAAVTAPDHKGLRPFRFLVIPHESRKHLAEAFVAAKRERDPSAGEAELQRAGEKAFRGPLLIAVVARIERDHPRVSANDQWVTVGAAVQNMLLAATSLGYGACLRSGVSATSRKVRQALGLAASEELAAFMMIGTASGMPPPRQDEIAGLITVWTP